jgi:peptidylprolyl isomerase
MKASQARNRTSAAPARWRARQKPEQRQQPFFICFDDAELPRQQYTVWGASVEGMEHVDALPKGEPPRTSGKIVKASLRD